MTKPEHLASGGESAEKSAVGHTGSDLLPMWLKRGGDELRRRASEIQHQIDHCKTEWWPAQLAILRDAHLAAASAYDEALRNTETPVGKPSR